MIHSKLNIIQLRIILICSLFFYYVVCYVYTSIRTPSLLKKSLSISKYLNPFKRVSTSIQRNLFTKDEGNFTADLQKL
jgi:hypothetical protein